MIASLTIVFREMLEMAIIIGILMAATRGVAHSRQWIFGGMGLGLSGAVFLAIFMEEMEGAFDGSGEFIFNAVVLLLASVLLAWTVVWMSRQGKEIATKMKWAGQQFSTGELSGVALLFIAFSAVVREGSEAVFFLFSAWQVSEQNSQEMITGAVLGMLLGAGLGYLLYRGLLKIPLHHVFHVIAWLLTLIAAGMASQACWNLVLIEWVPPLIEPLWDSSTLLSQDSMLGELLHVLMGYDERPSGLQVTVFAVTFFMITWLKHDRNTHAPNAATSSTQRMNMKTCGE
ncbi:MAG: FTR1 family protein [Mariprofundaceae bacterium]|nr:FTR1 family protein [Mariprofundaceae bacterium]